MNQNEEVKHYGILGMKWGHRRALYRLRGADSLRKNSESVKKDIYKAEKKINDRHRKAAKIDAKAANKMSVGKFDDASKYMKKSAKQKRIAAKREKNVIHNKKLLKLYEKRISELDARTVDKGKKVLEQKKK